MTWQMAWDLEEVSFATVEWVVLLLFAVSIIDKSSFADVAVFYVKPGIWIIPDLSSRMFKTHFSFNKSKQRPP